MGITLVGWCSFIVSLSQNLVDPDEWDPFFSTACNRSPWKTISTFAFSQNYLPSFLTVTQLIMTPLYHEPKPIQVTLINQKMPKYLNDKPSNKKVQLKII